MADLAMFMSLVYFQLIVITKNEIYIYKLLRCLNVLIRIINRFLFIQSCEQAVCYLL